MLLRMQTTMNKALFDTATGVYVGIDTSNYTTSVAVCDTAGKIIANLKLPLPVKQGERGLRQSDAVFAHVRNLPSLMEELHEILHPSYGTPLTVRGIGYSETPRRNDDSYMPCFLVGKSVAASLCAAIGAPMTACSHQEGHVMAALYSAGVSELLSQPESEFTNDFVAFHVSGGTTDVLLVHGEGGRFAIELLGTSLDLHAGQAIDRIGVALGLSFPCGQELETLASLCDKPVPRPRICVNGMNCHLSGLENLAQSLYQKTGDKALTAAYTLDFLGETLSEMSKQVQKRYPSIPMVFAGGVMSNQRIQALLDSRYHAYFSEPQFSADNASGVALLCRRQLQ